MTEATLKGVAFRARLVRVFRRVTTTILRWRLDYDGDATRRCFEPLPVGNGCDCQDCRNFIAALDQAFPDQFATIARALGIDFAKPAELAHWCREESGLLLVSGWFHFVGRIISGDDAIRYDSHGTGRFYLEQLTSDFQIGFSSRAALVPETFGSHPVVQLEFQTRIPFVLPEEYSSPVETATNKP